MTEITFLLSISAFMVRQIHHALGTATNSMNGNINANKLGPVWA